MIRPERGHFARWQVSGVCGSHWILPSRGGHGETHPVPVPDQRSTHTFEKDPGLFTVSWFPDGSHVLATRVASLEEKPSLWRVSVFGGSPAD